MLFHLENTYRALQLLWEHGKLIVSKIAILSFTNKIPMFRQNNCYLVRTNRARISGEINGVSPKSGTQNFD